MNYLNPAITDLKQLGIDKKEEYLSAEPFPNIVIDNFFNEEILNQVLADFPDLSKKDGVINYNAHNEKNKLEAKGEKHFSDVTKGFVHFLNSQPVLEFLQELTGIKETLLPDPYLIGGGYHEIKPGGLLKVHADFNKHHMTWLDRRINLLVYLNKDWDDSYGGHFELWDKDMTRSYKKVLPIFNRIAIFSTTDFSYHGHPDPLTCPPDRSRKSIALYYYSNGRPKSEVSDKPHSTLFVARAGKEGDVEREPITLKDVVREVVPPVIFKAAKKLMGKK
ncbi:2OG-Fe(II) oxygenase [Mucilaginibacter auburnensis]|uniref:2-oxoglutarate-Fe(II)-dependent oxygenase superfamily protein n=1 Tax=Mucilaginibacter auburnensis TaxID=1457233 RepID=A0A2H9VTD0_9SPHI|nr:2OG-Fe(II) oxygenase [Mucilaginibacter auburnensis]PJJ84083.1 2-oxoglutarate-Fe(II)-dependent oxygenase superfamily protein [Mucilaginibacter auburnensis]